jgi:hypothetical protein
MAVDQMATIAKTMGNEELIAIRGVFDDELNRRQNLPTAIPPRHLHSVLDGT